MSLSVLEIVLSSLVAVLVPVLTVYAKNAMDRRADEEERVNKRLQEQRADFNILLEPLRAEVARFQEKAASLEEKVDALESRLDQEERDSRLLLGTLYEAVQKLSSIDPPIRMYLPARVQELLSAKYNQV